MISVIIPTFNQEQFLGRCLRSILDQKIDRKDYEIIVINDGSNDKTSDILNFYKNDIKIINNPDNMGLPYSINKGIKNSIGRFIVRLDSDDYVNNNFLYILKLFLMENPEIDAVSCDYYLVDDKETIIARSDCIKKPIGCGIMFRIDQILELGLYDEKFLLHEDREFRIRFEKKYKIHRIPLPLYRYRKHSKNLTNDKIKMEKLYNQLKKKHKLIS